MAQVLVERERGSIWALAAELLRRRRLTGDEVGVILSATAAAAPMAGAPRWIT